MYYKKKEGFFNGNLRWTGTIFITGISASGKSTLGKNLKEDLLKEGIDNVKLIDGEAVRQELSKEGNDYGYSTAERNEIALKMAHIARSYNKEGMICILCSICHKKSTRKQMRDIIGDIVEVHLECPVSVCAKRDVKGHYARAFKGLYENFVGVTEPYQNYNLADLVIHTDKKSVDECADLLLNTAKKFILQEQD